MSALPMTLDAVYEDGVFRPTSPPTLKPKQRVKLVVQPREAEGWPENVAEIYAALEADDTALAAQALPSVAATWPTAERQP